MPNYSGIWTKTQQMQAQGASNWPVPPTLPGQQAYTTAGTYTWVAPATVTAVSVVAIGGGGSSRGFAGAGGGGGALAYKNNITVVPGTSYTVVVGVGSNINGAGGRVCGAGPSSFNSLFSAGGGKSNICNNGWCGGVRSGTYDGGGNGGNGGASCFTGGGGAGGYSGNGGNGSSVGVASGAGAGGGGSGGSAGAGGGVGILGQGTSGASVTSSVGLGGSGGGNGSAAPCCFNTVTGGTYGGGGYLRGMGRNGAVRIIWGTTVTRAFPSTNTGDL